MPAGGHDSPAAEAHRSGQRYKAVELQSADPRGLAERWSGIAGIPLRKDSRGRFELPLDNAAVRFVEVADGRGEGFSGVDIVSTDANGCSTQPIVAGTAGDDQVTICGTRFYLVRP